MGSNPTVIQSDCPPRPARPFLPSPQPARGTPAVIMNSANDNQVSKLTGRRLASLVQRALQIRSDVEAFEQEWPPMPDRSPMPVFDWTELERQLTSLAPDDLAPMVRDLISAVRKEAVPKPPEMVLREILIVSATVLDDGFREKWMEGTAHS